MQTSNVQISRDASPLDNQGGVQKWTTGSNSSINDLDGNQNQQCSNIGPPESTPTDERPKMKEKFQKWSREELNKFFTASITHYKIHQKLVQLRERLSYGEKKKTNKDFVLMAIN